MAYTQIRKVRAARKIDVSDPVASTNEALYCLIRQVLAVAKMKVMQVLPKSADAVGHGSVCDIPAFG